MSATRTAPAPERDRASLEASLRRFLADKQRSDARIPEPPKSRPSTKARVVTVSR